MNEKVERLADNIERVIIGKREAVLKIIAALLCGGHVLLQDVPGVGKSRLIEALAGSVSGKFNRIQMTPDIMPSDIIGFMMLDQETRQLKYRAGAALCNFLLADEINRASPKVQSGLLEIMEERKISIDAQTIVLPKPFITFATQNPIEVYGTYHLPEAQMDRFLIKASLGYLPPHEEIRLLDPSYQENSTVEPVLTIAQITELQEKAASIYTHPLVREYIMRIVSATRDNEDVRLGISPRGTLGLNAMAKAVAFIKGRSFVTPDDVVEATPGVLSHRLILSQRGRGLYKTQEAFVEGLLRSIPLPETPTAVLDGAIPA
jgi:MoxR-like ATPase